MPPEITNHPEPQKADSTTPSSGLSTEQTTSPPPETSTSTPQSAGPSPLAKLGKEDGLTFIPESETGISEWRGRLIKPVLSAIASDIELFISTGLIPYLLKLSPGDRRALSQKYVLEARYGLDEKWRGPNCSFRCMIRLYSKSHYIGRERVLLSIPLEELLKTLSHIQTPSPSSGESPQAEPPGESASE